MEVLISQRNLAEGQGDGKGEEPHLLFLTPWKYIGLWSALLLELGYLRRGAVIAFSNLGAATGRE